MLALVDTSASANQPSHLQKLFQIQVSGGDGKEDSTVYKLMTSVAGFVNSPVGIGRANAVFKLNEAHSLGEHSLYLELSKNVAKGKEILASYGKHYAFGEPDSKRARTGKGKVKAAKPPGLLTSAHQ